MPVEENLTAEIEAAAEKIVEEHEEREGVSAETEASDDQESRQSETEEREQGDAQETSTTEMEFEADEHIEDSSEGEGNAPEEKADSAKIAEQTITLSGFSDEALTRAVRVGLSVAEARSFPSEQALLSACETAERLYGQVLDRVPSSQATQPEEPEEDPLATFDKLDANEFEPEAAKLLAVLAGELRSQREQLRAFQATQEYAMRTSQEAVAREVEDWFDKQVAELGPDFQETLGDGGYRSLTPGSAQLANRDAIANQMAVLFAGYQAMDGLVPPREDVFKQAMQSVLHEELAQMKQAKTTTELRKRKKQHIQRAGGHGSKTETDSPDEETAALLEAKFFKK